MALLYGIIKELETKTAYRVRMRCLRNKMFDMGFSLSDIQTKLDNLLKSCEMRADEYIHQYHARVMMMLDNYSQTLDETDPRLNPNDRFKTLQAARKKKQ